MAGMAKGRREILISEVYSRLSPRREKMIVWDVRMSQICCGKK